MIDSRILPECHVDTLITRIALNVDEPIKIEPYHMPNINEVAKKLEKGGKAVGVIDDDKRKPKYILAFQKIADDQGLGWYKHPEKEHYLVQFSPASEQWLWDVADTLEIDYKRFKINSFKHFKSMTKSMNVGKNQNVKNFINAIAQKKNSPLKTMKKWINEVLDLS